MLPIILGLGMGVVFSVLGAGGGLITVPILLALFSLSLADAGAAALAIVFAAGLTSAVGYARTNRVDWPAVLSLGPASMLGAFAGASVSSRLPERVTAALFAVVLLLATGSFLRSPPEAPAHRRPLPQLVAVGVGLGLLTGVLGVGGGFLLVPVLVRVVGVPLKRAVGSSTVIIAASSLTGATTALLLRPHLFTLVLPLGAGAALGALLGVRLSGRLSDGVTRKAFAALALVVALGMGARALGVGLVRPPPAAACAPVAHTCEPPRS